MFLFEQRGVVFTKCIQERQQNLTFIMVYDIVRIWGGTMNDDDDDNIR